jgi:hypothetical protein
VVSLWQHWQEERKCRSGGADREGRAKGESGFFSEKLIWSRRQESNPGRCGDAECEGEVRSRVRSQHHTSDRGDRICLGVLITLIFMKANFCVYFSTCIMIGSYP